MELFDTELAARLLGYPRVGLATLVETILARSMRKEHSAVDWSKRPLPAPWLEYAALDVEVLLELRDELERQLVAAGKDGWAREEFAALVDFEPPVRVDPWRRTSGLHKARGRRAMAAVRELWNARDGLAADRDTTPGRLLPDSSIVAAANALPTSRKALLATPGSTAVARRGTPRSGWPRSHRPGAARVRAAAGRQPQRRSAAGARLGRPRPGRRSAAGPRPRGDQGLSKEHDVPAENLLTPDYLRRVLWSPPDVPDDELDDAVSAELRRLGARSWQLGLTVPLITDAIRHPHHPVADPED